MIFNISHFIASRKSWLILVIGNSSHTNASELPRLILTSGIVVIFSCFDGNLCYSLYIDTVM